MADLSPDAARVLEVLKDVGVPMTAYDVMLTKRTTDPRSEEKTLEALAELLDEGLIRSLLEPKTKDHPLFLDPTLFAVIEP